MGEKTNRNMSMCEPREQRVAVSERSCHSDNCEIPMSHLEKSTGCVLTGNFFSLQLL